MKTLTITVPIPPACLSPNGRPHWAAKARAVKQAKTDTAAKVLAATKGERPMWTKADLEVRAYFKVNRQRDDDNVVGSLKAHRDALKVAGLIVDDSGLTLRSVTIGVDRGNPRVELVVTKTGA